MNISRRSFLTAAASLLSSLSSLDLLITQAKGAGPGTQPGMVTLPPVTLRGYGTLSGTHRLLHSGQSSVTHVVCDSPQKAHLVQAKYLSDLGLLPGTSEATILLANLSIPIRRTSEGGAVACFAHGTDVLIFAAASEEHLKETCLAALPQAFAVTDFDARVLVPMWLDRWDKYGLMSYYGPGQTPPNSPNNGADYDFDTDVRFAKEHGKLGLVLWTNALTVDTAEGMTNEQTWSYVQERAKQLGVPVHINLQNSWPVVWLGNRYREETQIKAPQFLGGFYGVAHDSAPLGPLTWSSQAGEDALLGVLQETVRRFVDDPNVVGWLEPHAETSDTPQGSFTEWGPSADQSLRWFLQERYGPLAAVSRRWHGDANHFQSWNDVHAPEPAEFAGFGPDAIDLRGTWRVKYPLAPDGHAYTLGEQWNIPSPPPTAPIPPEWYAADFDDSGWNEFVAPGNDRMLTIPRSPLIYRRAIGVPADWLASKPQVSLYVWDMSCRDRDELILYVNGQKITGQVRGGGWSVFDVTKALAAGSNHLALNVPRGIICYRAYLTGEKPAQYPDLGPYKNAHWADYIAWYLWCRKAQMARGVEMIRQVDPNRSINLMAVKYVAPFKTIAQEYGCRFHDTGAMAGFWTDEPSVMMAGLRFPTSAEPGSPAPDAAQFQAFFGRWITEGVNGVHYFQSLGDIQWNSEALKTFEANLPLYQSIGKYHVPFAEVGVLYSTVGQQLTEFPWNTDRIGRAGYYTVFNAAMSLLDYCPRAGLSEDDLSTMTATGYRIIIDTNTMVMSKKLLDSIEAYVRQGGVFVTNGQTGRHDEVYPDTWPISKLTGYHVNDPEVWNKGMSYAPAPGQTVYGGPEWAQPRRSGGQSLKKVAAECQDLLLWTDGTVAAGIRPLGKGWIVHMGPTDRNSPPMRQIAAHFGVKRIPATYTSAPGLHFRHFIGNTGLQDIWVLFNESPNPVTTALTFLPGVHPVSLTDLLTGEAREIARSEGGGGDTVSGITLHPWQTVMYVSPRSPVAASPLEWLELQRGWWQGTKKPPARRLPRREEMQRFTLDLRDGWAYKRIDGVSDEQAAAFAQPSSDDRAWERRTLDLWRSGDATTPQRIMLRRTFTVPAHWNAGTVLLCSELPGGAFVAQARTFVDGKLIRDARWLGEGPYDEALGGIWKPGSTHHVAFDIRSPVPLIGMRCPYFLTYDPDPLGRQDLSGEWLGYADEMRAAAAIPLPGIAKNLRFVSRSVVINKAHTGRNVVLYARTGPGEMIRGVFINGRRLDPAAVGYERHDIILNVTPMVRFGEENTIEFTFNSTPQGTNIQAVEIRYYAKGFYP